MSFKNMFLIFSKGVYTFKKCLHNVKKCFIPLKQCMRHFKQKNLVIQKYVHNILKYFYALKISHRLHFLFPLKICEAFKKWTRLTSIRQDFSDRHARSRSTSPVPPRSDFSARSHHFSRFLFLREC